MNSVKKIFSTSESGVTLILVLMLVAAVGLLVIPVMLIGASGLRATNLSEQRFMERYAVDAGVEDALWRIKYENDGAPLFGAPHYEKPFNGLNTTINIVPAPIPTPMGIPPTQEPVSGGAMMVYKTVKPNYVEPCSWGPTCDPIDFTYTIYIENYGSSEVNLIRLGDCLPAGFVFKDVIDVKGIHNKPDKYVAAANLFPASWPPDTDYTEELDSGVPGTGTITFSLIKDDTTFLDPACPGGWQVKWHFASPRPWVNDRNKEAPGIGIIKFRATSNALDRGIYPNTKLWWEAAPSSIGEYSSDDTSPIVARFAEWDITSSAGGTAVYTRATVLKGQEYAPITIMSWQVE